MLGHAATLTDSRFDHYLAKPFLPSEIQEITLPYLLNKEEQSEKTPRDASPTKPATQKKKSRKKSSKKKEPGYRAETEVLNLDEIETIKALLEEDGLEVVHEEDLAEKVLQEREASVRDDQQNAVIDALRTMRPKQIRTLLKGTTVRIEITFPKG